jgi:hypothetical protein
MQWIECRRGLMEDSTPHRPRRMSAPAGGVAAEFFTPPGDSRNCGRPQNSSGHPAIPELPEAAEFFTPPGDSRAAGGRGILHAARRSRSCGGPQNSSRRPTISELLEAAEFFTPPGDPRSCGRPQNSSRHPTISGAAGAARRFPISWRPRNTVRRQATDTPARQEPSASTGTHRVPHRCATAIIAQVCVADEHRDTNAGEVVYRRHRGGISGFSS